MEDKVRRKDRIGIIIVRVILGSIFLMSGVNAFIPFFPFNIMPPAAIQILGGEGGYFFVFLKATEIGAGAFLLFNLFVPLTLMILAPIVINILLYSVFENINNLPMAIVVLAGFTTLVVYYRKIFFIFLKPQAYSHPWRDETAHVVILEEVEEKLPEKAKIVEEIILKLKSLSKTKKA